MGNREKRNRREGLGFVDAAPIVHRRFTRQTKSSYPEKKEKACETNTKPLTRTVSPVSSAVTIVSV